ncbi:MAG: 4-hydroxy-3-methylbut-2-enyl diphosphate reductase [Candidatus Zixiibacteriota bacterium]
MIKKIIIARHHGFCMGVKRAIRIAEETAQNETGRVTILKEIVHNDAVVDKFRQAGVRQSYTVDEVECGTLIISAHGVAPVIKRMAKEKGLQVVDATCSLVRRIYEIIDKIKKDYYIIHFGDPSHDETEGIVGHAPDRITVVATLEEMFALPEWKDRRLAMTVQTTANLDDFTEIEKTARVKWPHIKIFNTICNATHQRQEAIVQLAPTVDMVLVVGSATSANSKRLVNISRPLCKRAMLINSEKDIEETWFADGQVEKVGLTAGASTPDFLVKAVIKHLVDISGGKAEVLYQNDSD